MNTFESIIIYYTFIPTAEFLQTTILKYVFIYNY